MMMTSRSMIRFAIVMCIMHTIHRAHLFKKNHLVSSDANSEEIITTLSSQVSTGGGEKDIENKLHI